MEEKYTLKLNKGMEIPRLGMGTWFLGENKKTEEQEIKALRAGIDAGIQLIDTAEMYGSGKAEQLIGKAIQGYERDKLFLISKVYPHNAGRKHIFKSVQQTLKNLKTDYLDMYLLHWRGAIPLEETVACMEQLVKEGKIKSWGVSNFDTDDMEELFEIPEGTRQKNVIAIPRSGKAEHVLQNQMVWDITLSDEEYAALNAAYPAPAYKTYLDVV